LVLSEKESVFGLTAIACAMARHSKSSDKKWAKTVLADGNAENAALIEQFNSMAESVFTNTAGDLKVIVGQIQNYLKTHTYLVGDNITVSDVLLYLALYSFCASMVPKEWQDFCDVIRWLCHIGVLIESPFKPFALPARPYNHPNSKPKEGKGKAQDNQQKEQNPKENQPKENQPKQNQPKKEKKKPAPKPQPVADTRDPFSFIDIRVGKIVKVWNHPGADTLYREEIDIGGGVIKQVVTGVRNFVPIEQMQDRHVVVFCNIKPSKIRNEPSEAMVFAASDSTHEHVELLNPPNDTPIGTRVMCGDFVQGECPGVDSKGKYWKAVSAEGQLTVNDKGEACYKGVPLSLPQGSITVPTLRNCEYH